MHKDSTNPYARTSTRTDGAAEKPAKLSREDFLDIDQRFYTHMLTILSVSSGMVGVCLTAIGLIGIMKSLNKLESMADDLLAVGLLVFMVTAVLSFVGMRSRISKIWRGFTLVLDLMFCCGMLIMCAATVLLTWFMI